MHSLEIHDRMLTAGMGGVLPELADPTSLRQVLDVGCGVGNWLIETARSYPMIERLVGVDIDGRVLAYARTQVETQQLGERVQFETMDALRKLEFPDCSFDLVNQRAGFGWLHTWEWKKILSEYKRVTRPGGIVRITEGNMLIESNSLALTKFWELCLEAAFNSGHLFTATDDGLTRELVPLLTQHGFKDIQARVHKLVYRAGTVQGQQYYEERRLGFQVSLPYLKKYARLPDDYPQMCQQALKDMQQADFAAIVTLFTLWGMRH